MVTALRAHHAQRHPTSPLVFASPSGGLLHRHHGTFFRAVKTAGLGGTGVNVHCLRHTFASRLAAATGDLLLVKTLGGWSSLTMVQRYAHLAEGRAAQGIATMLAGAPSAAQDQEQHPRNPPRRIAGAAITP